MSAEPSSVRVRFCPSPTGNPHVGMVRTALFNWAYARHTGGTFVFRIEDTDSLRDTEESYEQLLAALSWLGLDWDEGPLVGGPYAPYRQSEAPRGVCRRGVGGCSRPATHTSASAPPTSSRSDARRNAPPGKPPGYDGRCRDLTDEEKAKHRANGREPVLRVRMPDRTIGWDDLVRGELSFDAEHVPDYVITRSNGEPLYTLVNPVDDALMNITHVLRGEDLLSSTPRQIALYEALGAIGIGDGTPPRFGHLPYVMGEGNKKLSKRDPQSSLNLYREQGFVPEGLLNYLALLGWSIAEDRDIFSMQEMADAFDIARVNPNPARFDLKKAQAINADWIRRLEPADLAQRIVPFLHAADLVADPPSTEELRLLAAATPLVQERMTVLSEAVGMLGFLFARDGFAVEEDARGIARRPDADRSRRRRGCPGRGRRRGRPRRSSPRLRAALVDELGIKPKHAFGPVRVAVTGRRVSPPIFESIELLGREQTLERLRELRASLCCAGLSQLLPDDHRHAVFQRDVDVVDRQVEVQGSVRRKNIIRMGLEPVRHSRQRRARRGAKW